MKTSFLNVLVFLAFLIILAVVLGAGWFLFGNIGAWTNTFGQYEEMDQEVTGSETFTGNIENLSVKAVAGPIRVESWEGDGIEVKYIKKGINSESLEKMNVRMEEEGETLRIWTEFPPGLGGNMGWVEYEILIPPGLGEMELKTVSGSINVGEESGVENFQDLDQKLETTSGSIYTSGSDDLDISSVSGSLKFTTEGRNVEADTVSGRITGFISEVTENQSIDSESVSGSIRLDLPADWTGEVKLSSISGSLKSGLPVILEKQSRTKLEGRIGDGNGRLKIETTSGSISIE